MRILIDINHPAHVHLFKNFAWEMQKNGHEVFFTTREKEIAHILLKNYGFPYKSLGKNYKGMLKKLLGIVKYDFLVFREALKFKPDIFLSMGSIYNSHAAFLYRKPNIVLNDTENATLLEYLVNPFASVLLTPACFSKKFGKKQIFYPGNHELAYLHPKRFAPDPKVLDEMGLKEGDKFVIMRFVSWGAHHDVGHSGLSMENKRIAVKEYSKYGKVFITSEGDLPDDLKPYQYRIAPEKIHHVMAYASLLFGESATMASECAVLGVPAIFIDNEGRGYTDEEEKSYGLVFNYTESEDDQISAIEKGSELLRDTLPETWKERRNKLLSEKIDVTGFLLWFVENYPESKSEYQIRSAEINKMFINSDGGKM
jgi:uncharacterized protein